MTDKPATIETIQAELLDLQPGLPVTVICSTAAEGSPADNVYDQKKSTSWSPAAEDPDPWVGLDFDETVYTDWFRLYGNLDSVTSYEIQMSEGGDDWSAVYSGTTAPESG